MATKERLKFAAKYQNEINDFENVCKNMKNIDPDDDQDWYSLSLGYFLAKGVSSDDSHTLSLHVRYDLQYWC